MANANGAATAARNSLEIVGVVVNMNVGSRIKLAEGAMPGAA
jgi:hypothetical protein